MFVLCIIVTACGGQQNNAESSADSSSTLVVDQVAILPTTDPYSLTLTDQWQDVYAMYDPLSLVNNSGQLQNYLADSWKNESPTSWLVTLKKGLKWSDGSPITSADVVFSVQRLLNPATKTIWTAALSYLASATAVGQYSVQITTKTPVANLPRDFGRMAIMPKAAFQKMGATAFFAHPVTSGPYMFESMVPGSSITLKANPTYHGGAPKVQTLVFRQVPDEATRVADVLSGAADIAMAIAPTDIQRVDSSGNAVAVSTASIERIQIDFTIKTDPTLQNPAVREAVYRAIDPSAINQAIYYGKGGLVSGYLSNLTAGYCTGVNKVPYSPNVARQLLSSASYSNGLPINVYGPEPSYLSADDVNLAIIDELDKAGFKATYKPLEKTTFNTMYSQGQLNGLVIQGIANTTGDADQMLRNIDSKRSDPEMQDAGLEELIDSQEADFNQASRDDTICQISKYVTSHYLSMTVMTTPNIAAVNKHVQGFQLSPYLVQLYTGVGI